LTSIMTCMCHYSFKIVTTRGRAKELLEGGSIRGGRTEKKTLRIDAVMRTSGSTTKKYRANVKPIRVLP